MWDLFCAVVDNYGDIGVSWRLARVLEAEHGVAVRLWVDDLGSFARIEPRVDPRAALQRVAGVEIRAWREPFPAIEPGTAVIEAFGCRLPETFLAAMARRAPAPVWVNLEYLTAEPVAAQCHGLPSPHPRLPLVKHFFFPGFGAGTGGVLRERGLLAARDACRQARAPGPLRVSLFTYPNPMLAPFLAALEEGPDPVEVLVPEGHAAAAVRAFVGGAFGVGETAVRGALTLRALPFTDQAGYDRLLWTSDWNFVRGEDSFVRAQWAARPLVWQPYPQEEGAHLGKLEAFLACYTGALRADARDALAGLARAWNAAPGAPGIGTAWRAAMAHGPELTRHARDWAETLATGPELGAALAEFIRARVK